ncbi:MAG: M48 family metallopeptidase [Thermoleophilaceae bacterium]|nr:M48 family metallopeptidase [Thermoleophilaceae bacterium]
MGLTVAAAAAATLLLRPRGGLIEPAVVDPTAYFSTAELERAADFRGLQRLIGLGSLAVSAGTLAILALRPPRRIEVLLERAGARPILGAAAVAAGLSLVLVVAGLPLSAWGHERAVGVGLSTQSIAQWLGDVAKSAGIGALFSAVGGAVAVALIRRFPARWWIPGAGVVVAFAVLTLYLSPVVIDPLFNRFEALPEGQLRSEVLDLADRAGVEVGEVYEIDASRRTTAINAYVGGLGQTKRVVLYDNLIEDFSPAQVRSVVAHELAHVKYSDVPKGILWVVIVAPAGLLAIQRLTEMISFGARPMRWSGARPITDRAALLPDRAARLSLSTPSVGPALLPALALSVGLVSFALTAAGNALSRPVEARADAFALELTRDPEAFIELERGLALRNVADPDPPAFLHTLFGTHPTTVERIGFGEAFER